MNKITFLAASAALLLAACSEPLQETAEMEIENSISQEQLSTVYEDSTIVLGKKITNPYTLENMRLAIEKLNKKHLTKSAISTDIQPTHYYIKFKPQNSEDIDKLESDTTIFYYSYPLDYEILEDGCYYHDPEIPTDMPTYQYCAVAVDQKLPDVEYEILENLYILEDVNVYEDGNGNNITSLTKRRTTDYWEQLEDEALQLAGLAEKKTTLTKRNSKWTPEGWIYYYDTYKAKKEPMQGVPVHMRKSMFVGHQCCTNANGYFSFSKIRKKVDFSIKWKRACFKIKPNTGASAAETSLAKDTRSAVNTTFYRNCDAWKYATIFRTTLEYTYGNICGLSKPTCSMISIRASNKEPLSSSGYY